MTSHSSIACNEDPGRFPELGYCVFREGLGMDEVTRYSELMEGTLVPAGRLGEPHFDHDAWLALCCHPSILAALEAALGTPGIVLFFSSVFVKQPRDLARVEWHQDNTYWPSVSGTDVVTVWVALDDVDEENSCMKVIPRTQAGYPEMEMLDVSEPEGAMLSRTVAVTPEMEAAAVPMILKAGQFSIHDSFLIHGSAPNRSDRRRAGYTIRYGNAMTTAIDGPAHTYGDLPELPVYYVRGNGAGLRDGYVDLRNGVTQ